MIIFASDLSLSSPGFSVLEIENRKVKVLHKSHVKTNTKKSRGYRLFEIHNHIMDIFKEFPHIDYVVREKGFSRFPSVTQTLFQVVGIHTVCAYRNGFDMVYEVSPSQVKKAVTGNGKADKKDVEKHIHKYISTNTGTDTNTKFANDDESDSVGVGITFAKQKKLLD